MSLPFCSLSESVAIRGHVRWFEGAVLDVVEDWTAAQVENHLLRRLKIDSSSMSSRSPEIL